MLSSAALDSDIFHGDLHGQKSLTQHAVAAMYLATAVTMLLQVSEWQQSNEQ